MGLAWSYSGAVDKSPMQIILAGYSFQILSGYFAGHFGSIFLGPDVFPTLRRFELVQLLWPSMAAKLQVNIGQELQGLSTPLKPQAVRNGHEIWKSQQL